MPGLVDNADRIHPEPVLPDPRDEYTFGTKIWATIIGTAFGVEFYGLDYDKKHPGNRKKWTLSSNALTWFGFDSVDGTAVDVPYGKLRRAALVMFLAWLNYHWTQERRKRQAAV